jgi:hypothetical protein
MTLKNRLWTESCLKKLVLLTVDGGRSLFVSKSSAMPGLLARSHQRDRDAGMPDFPCRASVPTTTLFIYWKIPSFSD